MAMNQFVASTCMKLKGHIRSDAKSISLIKVSQDLRLSKFMMLTFLQGMSVDKGELKLISELIHDLLAVDVSVLCGGMLWINSPEERSP